MRTDLGPRPSPRPPRRARSRRGEQSAGQVLVIMLVTLGLAALVNADALVDRAEHKPLGPDRDRSLAIWHPVQDIAHITQVHRLRQLGDWLVGNEDRGGAVVPDRGGPTTTVPPAVVRPMLRTPTAAAPLRVYIGGDSIVRDAGDAFLNIAGANPLFETTLHYENASGLTRPDFYDWPVALAEDMAAHRPEVAFIMFGGNDSQGIVDAAGETHAGPSDPGWRAEYARRVGAVMDILRAEDRLVYWIALPPMRETGFDGRAEIMNGIYREAAATRPWMTYFDTGPVFGDENGDYVERKPNDSGDLVDLRQEDGVHLSSPGAELLAKELLARIDAEIQAGATTTTTG
jgi:uncharacterized protein